MSKSLSDWLFDPSGLTPHGFCLLWKPGLIWTHAISDSIIAIAYFTIPAALAIIARRRRDLVFAPVFWLFSTFILLCGAGHWLSLLTLWVPVYGIEAVVKATTAGVSIITAMVLGTLLPKVLASHEALLTDMTRSKANEAVLRAARDAADAAARAKSEFLATMSHEIRSPMSGLVGVLDVLRGTALDPEQGRMTDMMHHSAMGLMAVLNDILDFSKIESGALSVAVEPTNVRDLVTHVARPQQVEAAGKEVALTLDFAPDIPEQVELDPLRLRQIVNNLLSNAVKFTAAGRVSVMVDILADGAGPKRLRMAVSDTGIGMGPATLAKLFSPFMQADGSTTRDFGGTGLGLCISLRLAQLLDGTLTATSEAGVGSTFTLLLPLVPASAPRAAAAIAAPVQPRMPGAHERVLVADDDPTNRWLARRHLESLGLSVDVAENGEAAAEMLRAGDYDLLLTDCHMPRMDGVALTRALRAAAKPALRELPIIGVTADVTESQRERCLDAGMTDVVIKPLGREKLAMLLARHLPGTSPAAPQRAEQAPGPQTAAFDTAIYQDLFEPGDPEGEMWIMEFQETAQHLDDVLDELLGEPVPADLRRDRLAATAHRLVGSALSVGAVDLGAAARSLERDAAAGDLASLRLQHAELRQEFARAKRAMAAFLATTRQELTA